MIHSELYRFTDVHICIYLVGQGLNVLGLPTVHPALSTVCPDMSDYCPSIVDCVIHVRHSQKILDYNLAQ